MSESAWSHKEYGRINGMTLALSTCCDTPRITDRHIGDDGTAVLSLEWDTFWAGGEYLSEAPHSAEPNHHKCRAEIAQPRGFDAWDGFTLHLSWGHNATNGATGSIVRLGKPTLLWQPVRAEGDGWWAEWYHPHLARFLPAEAAVIPAPALTDPVNLWMWVRA